MKKDLILAIDQGTTNTKVLIFDSAGRICTRASRPLTVSFPEEAWVEQDPLALWESVREAIAAATSVVDPARIAAIGISNQRESVVAWHRASGCPAAPCIVWQCRRSEPFCAELRSRGLEALLRAKTGLTIDPLFSAGKLRWLLEHIPNGHAMASAGDLCLGTVDSWLLWNLSGGAEHACDLSNASRTQLLNIHTAAWDDELLGVFDIPRAALPRVAPSGHIFGRTGPACGLPAGIPVAAMLGDSHAALFGHGAFTPGAVKATYGTGSSLMTLAPASAVSAGGLANTIAWARAGSVSYALEGNILATGSAVQWFGEFLGLKDAAAGVSALAQEVDDSAGVYMVPAFVGLGAPHWSPTARGMITGITRATSAAHVARATLESIAFQVRDVFDHMEEACGTPLPVLLADGGASRNEVLMQFQSDILDRTVICGESADVSALGAAWMAGLETGIWHSSDELADQLHVARRYVPRMAAPRREQLYQGWSRAVERATLGHRTQG